MLANKLLHSTRETRAREQWLLGVTGTVFACFIRNSSRSTKLGSRFVSTTRRSGRNVMGTSTVSP
jgi:hypothetical protein